MGIELPNVTTETVKAALRSANRNDLIDDHHVVEAITQKIQGIVALAAKTQSVSNLLSIENLVSAQVNDLDQKKLKEEQVNKLRELLEVAKAAYQKLIPGGDFPFIPQGSSEKIEPTLIALHRLLGNPGVDSNGRRLSCGRQQAMIARLKDVIHELGDLGKHFDIDHKPEGLKNVPVVILRDKIRNPNSFRYKTSTITSISAVGRIGVKGFQGASNMNTVFLDLEHAKTAYPDYEFILDDNLK